MILQDLKYIFLLDIYHEFVVIICLFKSAIKKIDALVKKFLWLNPFEAIDTE
ncbi:MAG: hypothetical protein HQK77_21495 [Desulfobacterales bacterium]|nr:hypothetical protein [Desulfobacterales bacterium]